MDGKGNAVGYAEFDGQGPKAFVRRKNGTIALWDSGTRISAVSDNGTTIGTAADQNQAGAFIGDLNGHMTKFAVKGLPGGFNLTGVNNAGEVIGFGYPDGGVAFRGFLRSAKGKSKVFDAPGAGTGQNQGTEPFAISANGLVCGAVIDNAGMRHGFVRDTAGNIQVFDPAGSIRTTAISIEKDGTIGGSYRDANSVYHAFRRAPDGTYTIFDAPGAGTAPGFGTFAYYINDKNVIVGDTIDDAGNFHGYVRLP